MKYIMTFFWSLLLVTMLNYVVSSVLNVNFDIVAGAIVSVVFGIIVLIIASILPNEPVADTDHH